VRPAEPAAKGRKIPVIMQASVTITATPTTATAFLSAVLVDLGPATVRDLHGVAPGITTLTGRTCWGASTTKDSSCYKKTAADTTHATATVFSRGWADLGTHASAGKGQLLTPGHPYTLTVSLAAADHVVPAGHRLALIVAGTDKDLIRPPADRPTITLDLTRTSLRIPVVGGSTACVNQLEAEGEPGFEEFVATRGDRLYRPRGC